MAQDIVPQRDPPRLLRPTEVRARIGLQKTAFYVLRRDDRSFPKPVKFTPKGRAIAFIESEITGWIEKRAKARSAE